MRGFLISFLLVIGLVVGFILGALNAQSGLMITGFCLTPIVLVILGWNARGAFGGRRVALVEVDRARSPQRSPTPRRPAASPSTPEGHTL